MSSPSVVAPVDKRQATTTFDRAFQNLFTNISDVIALYRQREAIDGGSTEIPVPVHVLEENLKAYKACFDTTGPDVHVDTVLELYAKVRSFLHRGYQCDSWLRESGRSFYYGVSPAEAGNRVLNLDCVFLMLESLKRADTAFRSQAAVLRSKFSYLLYCVFSACLRYAQVVEGEENVREVTPVVSIESDLETMLKLQEEVLSDLPKPGGGSAAGSAAGGPSPLAGIAAMFPGGLGDMVGSLMSSLPGITRTVTETVARTTGTAISSSDRVMIDTAMDNISKMLSNPDGMRSMLSELATGSDGITHFVERILTAVPQEGAGGTAVTAPPGPTPTAD